MLALTLLRTCCSSRFSVPATSPAPFAR